MERRVIKRDKGKTEPTVAEAVLAAMFLVFWVALGPILTGLGIVGTVVVVVLTLKWLL